MFSPPQPALISTINRRNVCIVHTHAILNTEYSLFPRGRRSHRSNHVILVSIIIFALKFHTNNQSHRATNRGFITGAVCGNENLCLKTRLCCSYSPFMAPGSRSLLGTPRRRRSRRRQHEEPAVSAGHEEQPHDDIPVNDQTEAGEIPEIPNPGEQNAAGVTVAPPSSQAQPVQARRAPVSSRLGPQAHQATPEGHVEDLTANRERELFGLGAVLRLSPTTRPSLAARLSPVIQLNSAAPPPPPIPGIEELLRNYLTTAPGREFLSQYTGTQGVPHFGPGRQDLRHHLQQVRGQHQGYPQPNSHLIQPNYAAAPPHGAPPQGHLGGGAQIFDAFGRIISPLRGYPQHTNAFWVYGAEDQTVQWNRKS